METIGALPGQPSPPGPAGHLALVTGLRRGELLGLRWDDLDLDRAELHVIQHSPSRLAATDPNTRGLDAA